MSFKIESTDKNEPTPDEIIDPSRAPMINVSPAIVPTIRKREGVITITGKYREGMATDWTDKHRNCVSEIRFCGRYLKHFGFPIGTRLMVTVTQGKIIITPHKIQPWLSPDELEQITSSANEPDSYDSGTRA